MHCTSAGNPMSIRPTLAVHVSHGGHERGHVYRGHRVIDLISNPPPVAGVAQDLFWVHSDGLRHGEGTLTLRDGTKLSGTWSGGELRGTHRPTLCRLHVAHDAKHCGFVAAMTPTPWNTLYSLS